MSIQPRRESEGGSALVELSIAITLLVLVMLGAVDFARVFYTAMELNNAARAGAQYGAATLGQSGDFTGMQTAAQNAVNIGGVTASASRLCQCASDAGGFSATSPSANNCTSPASTSCPGNHVVITVTVTATKTFNMIASLVGVPNAIPLTRAATMRAVN